MDKFIQQWNKWDIQRREQFLSNIMLSLFVTGLVIPTISGMLSAALDAYQIIAFGSAIGLSLELLAINLFIWKSWIKNVNVGGRENNAIYSSSYAFNDKDNESTYCKRIVK